MNPNKVVPELQRAQAAFEASLAAIEGGDGDTERHRRCLAQLREAEAAAERERSARKGPES